MSTTLYLPSSGLVAPITPTRNSWWNNDSSNFAASRMDTAKTSTSMVSDAQSVSAGTDMRYRNFCSPPLSGSGTISGTVSVALSQKANTFTNVILFEIIIDVWSSDGLTNRGSIIGHTTCTFFAGTTQNSSYINAAAITSVTYQDGDYINMEIGVNNGTASTDTGTLWFGDNGGTDLPYSTQSTSATANPSVQFSSTLTFKPWVTDGVNNALMMLGMGT